MAFRQAFPGPSGRRCVNNHRQAIKALIHSHAKLGDAGQVEGGASGRISFPCYCKIIQMRKALLIRLPRRKFAKHRSDGMSDLIRGGVPLGQHNKRIHGAQQVPLPQTLPVPDGCSCANPPLIGAVFI